MGLAKDTSNLFRDRSGAARRRLDVREFCEVLHIDAAAGIVEAEGTICYEALVAECLAHGVMPAVVPQLKTITLGGAVSGVGIESSSHRHGLVHDTVLEIVFRRFVFGRRRLGSRTYTRIMRWNSRLGLTRKAERVLGLHSESVIQDVDIPLARAGEFLDFYACEIGPWPQWICPIGPQPHSGRFALYPVRNEWYVNFGFWDVKRTREAHARGHFNRLIEDKVADLGGIKSLYSESFFSEQEFDRRYGGEAYRALKAKYDPGGAFAQLYAKCVLRQ